MAEGKYEITIYTSCCNATKGIYYYTTYDNHGINAVDMKRAVSYTHLRAHETDSYLVCRLLLEKKKKKKKKKNKQQKKKIV